MDVLNMLLDYGSRIFLLLVLIGFIIMALVGVGYLIKHLFIELFHLKGDDNG